MARPKFDISQTNEQLKCYHQLINFLSFQLHATLATTTALLEATNCEHQKRKYNNSISVLNINDACVCAHVCARLTHDITQHRRFGLSFIDVNIQRIFLFSCEAERTIKFLHITCCDFYISLAFACFYCFHLSTELNEMLRRRSMFCSPR